MSRSCGRSARRPIGNPPARREPEFASAAGADPRRTTASTSTSRSEMLDEEPVQPAQVQNFRSPAGAARRQPRAAPGARRPHAARGADLADRLGPLRDAVAAFPVRAEERRARFQPVEGRAGTERAPARRRARGFRRQGRDHPCPARPGRDALRARAGARHQVVARHRACRRHRPLDERHRRPRRRRPRPQRHRHRAAQRQARDRLSARAPGQPRFRDDQVASWLWRSARPSTASR